MSYSGWANYETWVTVLWIDNDPGTYTWARELLKENRHSPAAAADALKQWVEETFIDPVSTNLDDNDEGHSGLAIDLLRGAFSGVDWHEIVTNWMEDLEPDDPP